MYPIAKSLEFKDFYNQHQAQLKNYLLKKNKDNHTIIDDMLQDIFLAIHPYFHRVENPIRRIQILFGIAKRKLVDHYRRRDRDMRIFDSQVSMDSLTEQIAENDTSNDESEIFNLFQQLSEKDKAILTDKYFLKKSMKDMAVERQISEKAVESQLVRSREKLKHLSRGQMRVDYFLVLLSLLLAFQGIRID